MAGRKFLSLWLMLGDGTDGSGCGFLVWRVVAAELGWWSQQLPAQVLQQPQPGRGHGEPAPAAGGAVEHGPHQRQAGVLAGKPADHLDPAAGLAKGALDEVGM